MPRSCTSNNNVSNNNGTIIRTRDDKIKSNNINDTNDKINTYKIITTKNDSKPTFIKKPTIVTRNPIITNITEKKLESDESESDESESDESESVWKDYNYTKKDHMDMCEMIVKYGGFVKTKETNNIVKPNNKRKNKSDEMDEKSTKRIKIFDNNDTLFYNKDKMLGWVSATRTKYYLLNDQSIDWLNMYYDKIGIGPEYTEQYIFTQKTSGSRTSNTSGTSNNLLNDSSHIDLLFDGGNAFERKIFEELKDIFKDGFVLVFTENDMKIYREQRDIDGMIREKNEHVKTLMNRGIPIIAQAPLINDSNRTFGVADILIRSDYLPVLFKTFTPDTELHHIAPFLSMTGTDRYHYRVIDIKWTTMVLCVDGLTIRNEDMFPAYKGQLAVYTAALEPLQGYVPNYAYIMPKAWRIDKSKITDQDAYRGYSAFDRPGVINYAGRDNVYLTKTKEAIQWMQRVMTEGREWRYLLDKPTIPEMYPNVNKSFNPAYDKIKETLADRYGDPTLVWYVGSKHRKNAHSKGIYDIRDPGCTLDILGIPEKGRGNTIKEILNINRNNQTTELVRPKKIILDNKTIQPIQWWKNDYQLDYYIDFETINYNLYTKPNDMDLDKSYIDSEMSFMIGIGFNHSNRIDSKYLIDSLNINHNLVDHYIHIDKDKNWEFVCFYLVHFKGACEVEAFRLFYQFIILRQELYNMISNKPSIQSRLFHWTDAEIRFVKKATQRIVSGEYTQSYMENKNLNFNEADGSKSTIQQVQCELNRLVRTIDETMIWIDMCKVFEKTPITVKGSFRFKLKHIGNAFYKNGLIDTSWDDGAMSNGFKAMIEAIKLYRTQTAMSHTIRQFKEIIDYNEIDCRVIWEIVHYLRTNH
jgi:hypothetical protein